jgi:hypothetical protein
MWFYAILGFDSPENRRDAPIPALVRRGLADDI